MAVGNWVAPRQLTSHAFAHGLFLSEFAQLYRNYKGVDQQMITVTFPDGAQRQYESQTTVAAVAASISNSLAKKALAGKFNGQLVDLGRPLNEDGVLELVTPDHEDALGIR